MFDIKVIGIKFIGQNQIGDFYWMCNQAEYSNSLFIFNDNEEYHGTNRKGAGNAIMRKLNKYSNLAIPISAGIPTGTLEQGGYTKLNAHSKKQIDWSINEIIELINFYDYKKIYYSSELDGILGTSIFEVDKTVLKYITHKIFSLTNYPVQIIKLLPNNYFESEFDILNKTDLDSD